MKHRHRTVRVQALFSGNGQASVCSCGAARLWSHGPTGYRPRGSWRKVEGLRHRKPEEVS